MRLTTFLFLLFSFHLQARETNELLHKTKNKIVYGRFGKPYKQGFWETDEKGRPLKLIMGVMQSRAHMIVKEGSETKLVAKRETLFNEMGHLDPAWNPVMNKKSCEHAIDLSQESGPVRDQWENTCYANVALDLVTFKVPGSYSALYAAHLNQMGRKIEDSPYFLKRVAGFNGGTTGDMVKLILENGICPQDAIKDSFLINNDRTMHYDNILIYFENQKLQGKECDDGVNKISTDISTAFPGLGMDDFKKIFNKSESVEEFIRGLYSKACEGKINKEALQNRSVSEFKTSNSVVIRNNKVAGVFEEDRAGLLAHINDTLMSGKPAAALFNMNSVLVDRYSDEVVTHGTLIVGREWQDEKVDESGEIIQSAGCYYVAKNSWGEDWTPPKDVKGRPWKKTGYFMISEQDLMDHLFETNSF